MNSSKLIELAKYLIENYDAHIGFAANKEAVVVARTMREVEFARMELTSILRHDPLLLDALDYFEFIPVSQFSRYITGRPNIVTYIQYEPFTLSEEQEHQILIRILCTQGDSKFAPMVIKAEPRDFIRNRRSNAKGGQASFVW